MGEIAMSKEVAIIKKFMIPIEIFFGAFSSSCDKISKEYWDFFYQVCGDMNFIFVHLLILYLLFDKCSVKSKIG